MYLLKRDGFLANPKLATKHNVQNVLKSMSKLEYQNLMKNMTFHDLTTFRKPPRGVGKLLGLSLSFCLQTPLPNQDIDSMMARLRRDVRRKVYFSGRPKEDENDDSNYNPKIYIPSTWQAPDASKEVEERMNMFDKKICKLQAQSMQQRKVFNLTRRQ